MKRRLKFSSVRGHRDKFSYDGKFYKVKDVSGSSEASPETLSAACIPVERAISPTKWPGERGWGIFVPPLLPWGVLEKPLGIYKKACAEHGHKSEYRLYPARLLG